MFAIEYATLFDLIDPGLAALDLPIPLGGTSNHFRGIRQETHVDVHFRPTTDVMMQKWTHPMTTSPTRFLDC